MDLHVCPPEIEGRVKPGHREGDLIKSKASASAESTLNKRSSGYLMNDATATSAVEGFGAALNHIPLAVRNSMACSYAKFCIRKKNWLLTGS